jgi:hypothetical protein
MFSIDYLTNDAGVDQVFKAMNAHAISRDQVDFEHSLGKFIIDNKEAFVVLCTCIWRKHVRNSG